VYRSYGVHALLNAVTEREGVGAAVLIRALEPLEGIADMRDRRGLDRAQDLCSGPGKLTQALGIELHHNGTWLSSDEVLIGPRDGAWTDPTIVVGPRVGINRATELPWRFCVADNHCVSRPRPNGTRARVNGTRARVRS
jgi:DNA-3-methyladenine glycosylase